MSPKYLQSFLGLVSLLPGVKAAFLVGKSERGVEIRHLLPQSLHTRSQGHHPVILRAVAPSTVNFLCSFPTLPDYVAISDNVTLFRVLPSWYIL